MIQQRKIRRTIDDYFDKCFIYGVLLNQSVVHFNRLKTLFKIPLILISSIMSILNSYFKSDDEILKILNISLNVFTALLLSLSGVLKIEEKQNVFFIAQKKFLKLGCLIEQKVLENDDDDNEQITKDFCNSIINQYNEIEDSIQYDIPSFICKRVRNQYAGQKTLPLIINGIKKQEEYRSPACSTTFSSSFKFAKKFKQDYNINTIEIKQDSLKPLKFKRHNSDTSLDERSNHTAENKREKSPILKISNNIPQVLDIKPIDVSPPVDI